jgi:hypothetical protein
MNFIEVSVKRYWRDSKLEQAEHSLQPKCCDPHFFGSKTLMWSVLRGGGRGNQECQKCTCFEWFFCFFRVGLSFMLRSWSGSQKRDGSARFKWFCNDPGGKAPSLMLQASSGDAWTLGAAGGLACKRINVGSKAPRLELLQLAVFDLCCHVQFLDPSSSTKRWGGANHQNLTKNNQRQVCVD